MNHSSKRTVGHGKRTAAFGGGQSRLATPALRVGAVAALGLVVVLAAWQLEDLRGELAFARFDHVARYVGVAGTPAQRNAALEVAHTEAGAVIAHGSWNPQSLWQVSRHCLRWARRHQGDPRLLLRLAERAQKAVGVAVWEAPADYRSWRQMARTQLALGQPQLATISLRRARELAPPGVELDALPRPRPRAEGNPHSEE